MGRELFGMIMSVDGFNSYGAPTVDKDEADRELTLIRAKKLDAT